MARPGQAARNLTLTEELEKLEQSITLTLQEIDHNFSKAHRIVTTSIIPVVEQYGEHSKNVWEASKFWKQFFEASANVSLSGYEELANDDENNTTVDESSFQEESTTPGYTPRNEREHDETDMDASAHTPYQGEDSLLDDDDDELTGSTPRVPATKTIKANFSSLESPYEALKRELKGEPPAPDAEDDDDDEEDSTVLFAQHTARLPDMSMTPRTSLPRTQSSGQQGQNKDPLLHRILDKNYRLQATPHKGPMLRISPLKRAEDDGRKGKEKAAVSSWQDSPMSSPIMEAPKLRSEAFMSPAKARAAAAGPRTPGVSVQTPAGGRKTRDVFRTEGEDHEGDEVSELAGRKLKYEIDWDSDSDDGGLGGMSPPKTIQFALPPSKLMQTPAREASKRIVDDILLTAGAEPDEGSEYSPTMVKMNQNILDDSF